MTDDRPDRPRPAARLANAGMIAALLAGAAVGGLALWVAGAAWFHFLRERASGATLAGGPWAPVVAYTCLTAGTAVPAACVAGCLWGVVRRVRTGGRRGPRSLAAGPRFADRLRGLLLLGLSLGLGGFVLWFAWMAFGMWRAGRFGPAVPPGPATFYSAVGAWTFGATASACGAVSAARRLLAPPDREAG